MMYPVAVDGQMPFVDHKSYRDQQIKKVIQKHRAKRQKECIASQSRAVSPLHTTVFRVSHRETATNTLQCDNKHEDNLLNKHNILRAIKRWFSINNKSKKSTDSSLYRKSSQSVYQPRFSKNRTSAPINIGQSRKLVSDPNSPPGVSPKRQRRRTVSNIGSIMETIEEIPEHLVLADDSDSGSSEESFSSNSSLASNLDLLLQEVTGHASYSSSIHSSVSHCDDLSSTSASNLLLPCSA